MSTAKDTSPTPPRVVSAIYKNAPEPHRTTMLEMRRRILRIIPQAEEVVSYGLACFKLNGVIVCGLGAAKKHVGYYPFSGDVLHRFSSELRNYSMTKSALHVPLDKPLSVTLLRTLINARISKCDIKNGTTHDASKTTTIQVWASLGLAAPAQRALVNNKITRLQDLTKWREIDVANLHGMGPRALSLLKNEMKRQRISFRVSVK